MQPPKEGNIPSFVSRFLHLISSFDSAELNSSEIKFNGGFWVFLEFASGTVISSHLQKKKKNCLLEFLFPFGYDIGRWVCVLFSSSNRITLVIEVKSGEIEKGVLIFIGLFHCYRRVGIETSCIAFELICFCNFPIWVTEF